MEVRFFASHRVPAGIMRMNGLVAAFVEIRMEAASNTAEIFFDQRKRHLILQNPLLRRNAAHKAKLPCIDRNRFAVKVRMNRSQWIDLQIDVFQRVLRPEEKLQATVLANLTVIFRFLRQKQPFIRLKVYKNARDSACELCRCGDFLFKCRPRKTVDRECRDSLPDRVFNADVAAELEKPGRDPREALPPPVLRTDVLAMSDLTPGMELTGTVRNVIDFGAFVDIGVHQDGLVHISRMADRFIRHPSEVVSVGDVVKVWVVSVDEKKKRIALTMVKGRT